MKFTPDTHHCPESCLCPICSNDNDCEEVCEEYKQMANDCYKNCDDSYSCKLKRVVS